MGSSERAHGDEDGDPGVGGAFLCLDADFDLARLTAALRQPVDRIGRPDDEARTRERHRVTIDLPCGVTLDRLVAVVSASVDALPDDARAEWGRLDDKRVVVLLRVRPGSAMSGFALARDSVLALAERGLGFEVSMLDERDADEADDEADDEEG